LVICRRNTLSETFAYASFAFPQAKIPHVAAVLQAALQSDLYYYTVNLPKTRNDVNGRQSKAAARRPARSSGSRAKRLRRKQ
jgi:hypothetical protein